MKRYLKIGVIFLFLSSILICIWWYFMIPYFDKLDNRANQEFAEKARQLQIVGKSRDYILKHFGEPDYIKTSNNREILVYIPGPMMALWSSECKIGVDTKTGLVDGWQIGSD